MGIPFLGSLAYGGEEVSQHDVLPILHLRCTTCHGRQKKEADLDLRTVQSILKGSKNGLVVKRGEPKLSKLVQKIIDGEMPPKRDLVKASVKPVPEGELKIIQEWIKTGMPVIKAGVPKEPAISETDKAFWSFNSPKRPEIPISNQSGNINPIDAFIAQRLNKQGLSFASMASRRDLGRRVYYGLTGLPPSLLELKGFELDDSVDAFEKLIDRLLISPAYGERWARFWLDLAGYADSEGIQHADRLRPWAYRYRDYVIRAFNSDKPYDRFLIEQIAGDELVKYDDPDSYNEQVYDQLVATGFLRMVEDGTYAGITNFVPDRQDTIDNEMRVLGSSVLGMTLHCARCHSHKFDPISQADYFRLRAIFKGAFDEHDWLNPGERRLPFGHPEELVQWRENKTLIDAELVALRENESLDEASLKNAIESVEKRRVERPMIRALWDRGQPSPTYLLNRGDYLQPRDLVEPDVPRVLASAIGALEIKAPWANGGKTGRRLSFAKWLTRKDHPLTARVMVNRLWKHHFGHGLVRTLDDFGKAGEQPTHPELLDWLAVEFMDSGWSIKHMHRLILTSRAYRQTSRVSHEQLKRDPENKLWSRMPLMRLQGEALRDSMLFLSGRLRLEQFGPADQVDVSSDGLVMARPKDGTWRRSVYLRQRRTEVPTLLASFDLPVMSPNCVERTESNVVTQALHMMNNKLIRQLSDAFANRVAYERPDGITEQLLHAFRLALGRDPDQQEILLINRKLEPLINKSKEEALQAFCHALFNTAEFLYLD
jgi:hypothetical protein